MHKPLVNAEKAKCYGPNNGPTNILNMFPLSSDINNRVYHVHSVNKYLANVKKRQVGRGRISHFFNDSDFTKLCITVELMK